MLFQVTVEKELFGASAEDDMNLKKLKYMDVSVLILLFRYLPRYPSSSFASLMFVLLQILAVREALGELGHGHRSRHTREPVVIKR